MSWVWGLLVATGALGSEPAWLQAGPMLGHVGTNEARIWVKASRDVRTTVEYSEDASMRRPRCAGAVRPTAADDFSATISIQDLRPATRYHYRIRLDGEVATARPYPSFVTAPELEVEKRFRFGFGSCVGRAGYLDAAAWADMARTNVNFFLMLGDNHYADTTDPAGQRAGFLAHRSQPSFVAFGARIPMYGIWDDHDFGPNNSDGTAVGKEFALQVFREHWPNPGYGQRDDPGVYFAFRRGDAEFFMLDGRYHRTPNKASEDGTKTMLGVRQLEWLKDGLRRSTARLKFIACGSEWQSQSTDDSWTSFRREKAEIFEFLMRESIEGVVLLSGDRHFTAAYQVESRWIEVTSGPLGSGWVTPRESAEKFLGYGEGRLYTIFDVNTEGDEPELILEVYRVAEGLVALRKFSWTEITGRAVVPRNP